MPKSKKGVGLGVRNHTWFTQMGFPPRVIPDMVLHGISESQWTPSESGNLNQCDSLGWQFLAAGDQVLDLDLMGISALGARRLARNAHSPVSLRFQMTGSGSRWAKTFGNQLVKRLLFGNHSSANWEIGEKWRRSSKWKTFLLCLIARGSFCCISFCTF